MEAIAKRLWDDEAGFVVSLELILIATIVVIGLIVGLTTVRNAVVQELSDVAGAAQDINQTYEFNSVASAVGSTAGSDFSDTRDYEDSPEDPFGLSDNGIIFDGLPSDEL
jgi:Flp pilus assembly pilin Flp